ncbi:MAG: 30S ribosomal protein S26e [Candidatus Bathyarchaeota archaeon]|jgi:small subunit ribosomal protein S26e
MSKITRRKGKSGRAVSVECSMCGAKVPRDKAIEKQRRSLPLDRNTRRLLREKGAKLHTSQNIVYYCVSCAKHRKYV